MILNLLVFLIAYVVILTLAIPLHETGHLVCGLLSGYKFLSYRVFSFIWYKESGKVRFKVSRNKLVMGQCLMAPPEDEADFRYVLYNLGGGLANLLFALGSFAILRLPNVSDWAVDILMACLVANFVLAAMNLIPLNLSVPNDGMNVWMATRSPEAAHGLYLMLRLNHQSMEGKRYRDYTEDFATTSPDATNYLACYPLLCQAAKLYDQGEYRQSIQVYDWLDVERLQSFYRRSIYADYVYYYAVHQRDAAKAREYYEKKGMAQLLNAGMVPYLRILAAYEFFVNNDHAKGRKLLAAGKEDANGNANHGLGIMEGEYLRRLEEAMDAEEGQLAPGNDGAPS